MALFATDVTDVAQWRQLRGISRVALAYALSVSVSTIQRWETGRTRPGQALRVRLLEMMRHDADDHLALTKLLIRQSRALSALFDFSDIRLLCASQGLKEVWPNFCAMTEQPFLPFLSDDARRLMADRAFVREVRQGQLLGISGVADRHVSIETDPPFRHRWSATFRAYGPKILAELNYERCHASEAPGIHGVIRFGSTSLELREHQFIQEVILPIAMN